MAEVLTPDLCVIGAGAGGFAVASEARAMGATVVVVERGRAGGGGVQASSVASKALVEAARHAHAIRSAARFGINPADPTVDFPRLRNHIRSVVAAVAPASSLERLTALGAQVIAGEGKFIDERTLGVGETLIRARRFVIATGSQPTLPAIEGLETAAFFTSQTIIENARRPTHMVIVGAGATGAELGQAFRRLGADITLVELENPLTDLDPELGDVALRRIADEGVLIRSGTTVPRVAPREGGGAVVTIAVDGAEETISASHLLVAIGRLPNLDLDLERAGIRRSKTDPNRLELSPGLRTTNRRIYAVGDATGSRQSVGLTDQQARVVVRGALQGLPLRHHPELVPFVLFTDPEIATVGMTEDEARRRYKDSYHVVRWPYAGNDRARTRHETAGLCKLVCTPTGRILGAGLVGPDAGELIALFSLAISSRLTLPSLARFAPAYPSLAELANRVAAEALAQRTPPAWASWTAGLRRLLP